MAKRSKYNYKCPRCGNEMGTDIDPEFMKQPYCKNYVEHHSKKMYLMEEVK